MLFSKFASRVIHKHGYFSLLTRWCSSGTGGGSGPSTCEAPAEGQAEGGNPGLVLGVYDDNGSFELTAAAEEINQKSGGKVCQKLNELSCSMKLGSAHVVTDLAPGYGPVALASYGPRGAGYNQLEDLDEGRENIRIGVGAGVRALTQRRCAHIAVDAARAPGAAAEAAALAAWRFQEFKSCMDRDPVASVSMFGSADDEWAAGAVRGQAQNWARYLSDMPANKMTPVDVAQAALDTLCPLGIKVTCRERAWIQAQRMEALLCVARGSCEQPMFLECEYRGAAGPPVLLAAKGVTFDSGGLCLKRPEEMVENRGSMAGAAVALAALKALAELKVPINVVSVIPLCENMISGQCMKVGDMVRALNNLSIQIEDTDMEGRLMLADALVYGQSVYRPSLVVDVATLTHGILLATGGGAFGAFTSTGALWRTLQGAGGGSGDRPWRFPLWGYYQRQITNEAAVDLRNKGSGMATPCLGAAFLKNFVCGDWVHLDITGVGKLAHSPPSYLDQHRMTGRPARTLIYFFEEISRGCLRKEPDRSPCDNKT